VFPAGKDFKAGELAGAKLNKRLETGEKLALFQCPLRFDDVDDHAGMLRQTTGLK